MTLSLASGKEILSNNYANACGVALAAQQGVSWLHVIDLTDPDYDALFAAMKDDMPRIWREVFPLALAQLEATGVLTIHVTDTEITVSSTKPPATAVYRVARKPRLH
jgi:hypothetical protein